jgi:hypothetical protein
VNRPYHLQTIRTIQRMDDCNCDWNEQKALINYKLDVLNAQTGEALSSKRFIWPLVVAIIVMLLMTVTSVIAIVQLFNHH